IDDFIAQGNHKTLYIDDYRIGLIKIYEQEKDIANKLHQLIHRESRFKVVNMDRKIKKIEEEQGFSFTEEQLNAIKESVENNVIVTEEA
ncbi:hypothetical protein SMA37_26375, partial [Escherichia coli]|uniref:hypothetical protein n=1 Tax=Escherichia coli TaxID=562 RepID=UPI00307A0436